MTQVSVTVGDDHRDSLDGVVENLRASGLQVDQVLGTLGIVTGSAPDDALDALRGVEGVASVDAQLTHRLPPPDAPVQ
ncbi:ketohydroxyglutarate aldolase [Blastococcus litoris]|uniref:ketohydroxyglutarate aldolase n=1 Tax=Blastococcus litoris TaxID=2171622 RepID=UPI000E304EA9|nr:ketohydroxyglutarate aldolase [Blastococcus litoris]